MENIALPNHIFLSRDERHQRMLKMTDVVNTVKRELPNAGIRREGNVSVFVANENELAQLVVFVWKSYQ